MDVADTQDTNSYIWLHLTADMTQKKIAKAYSDDFYSLNVPEGRGIDTGVNKPETMKFDAAYACLVANKVMSTEQTPVFAATTNNAGLFRFWVFPNCTFLDISTSFPYTGGLFVLSAQNGAVHITAEGYPVFI